MLIQVNIEDESHQDFLYELLAERYQQEHVNIEGSSLKEQPDKFSYIKWLKNNLPKYIYLWEENSAFCAVVFLRESGLEYEIGIFVLREKQGQGIGKKATSAIIQRHPVFPIIARINPQNEKSNCMFESLGFKHTMNVWLIEAQ